jgi:hypothetical protein
VKINICNATAMLALPLVLATDANNTKHLRVRTTNMNERS